MFERSNTTTLVGIVDPLKIVDISIFVNSLLLRFLPNTQKHNVSLIIPISINFFSLQDASQVARIEPYIGLSLQLRNVQQRSQVNNYFLANVQPL